MGRKVSATAAGIVLVAAAFYALTEYESYSSLYDATYVGSEECGTCHNKIYPEWERSPHAKMTRRAGPSSVVGDFDDHVWYLPEDARRHPDEHLPAARMFRDNDR